MKFFRFIAVFTLLLGASNVLMGQTVNLVGLFRASMKAGYTTYPTRSFGDSLDLEQSSLRMSVHLPLSFRVGGAANGLGVSVKQTMVHAFAAEETLNGSPFITDGKRYHFALGASGGKISTKGGISAWVARAGFRQDTKEKSARYTFYGYGAWLKIRPQLLQKTKLVYYGVGVAWTEEAILPIPLIGFRRKLTKKAALNVLLPVQASLTQKFGKRWLLEWELAPGSRRTPILDSIGEPAVLRYQYLRNSFDLTAKVTKRLRFMAGVGFDFPAYVKISSRDFAIEWEENTPFQPTPWVRAAVRWDLGKLPFGSRLFEPDFKE